MTINSFFFGEGVVVLKDLIFITIPNLKRCSGLEITDVLAVSTL